MSGFLFYSKSISIEINSFQEALNKIRWRGGVGSKLELLEIDRACFGIYKSNKKYKQYDLDIFNLLDRYVVLFDGYILNVTSLKEEFDFLESATVEEEVVLIGFLSLGYKFFSYIEGGFALVIFDKITKEWIAAKDVFGIKPLFFHQNNAEIIFCSDAAPIATLINSKPCKIALEEWKIIRRPIPGKTFFEEVEELLPGSTLSSFNGFKKYWSISESAFEYRQEKFEELLNENIRNQLAASQNYTALLSGGLDSAIVSKLIKPVRCYSIGLTDNNEFDGAQESSEVIGCKLKNIIVSAEELKASWVSLTKLRGEPLSLPNEGLIFIGCQKIPNEEKVIFTGEGADELFFGYDGIFRWATELEDIDTKEFLLKYGYSQIIGSKRLVTYVDKLKKNKRPIDFVEDFFFFVHLPNLLRRMEVPATAAGKEVRMPFISKDLFNLMYRKSFKLRLNKTESKIPVRILASKLMLSGALERKKIGFSAVINNKDRKESYKQFQDVVLGALEW